MEPRASCCSVYRLLQLALHFVKRYAEKCLKFSRWLPVCQKAEMLSDLFADAQEGYRAGGLVCKARVHQ